MATYFSNTLVTNKTIREYFAGLSNKQLKITIGETETLVYCVDVIWDGGNYYIAYSTSETAIEADVIASLDAVLPITIVDIGADTGTDA